MRDGGERLRELLHSTARPPPLGGAPPRVRRAPARARAAPRRAAGGAGVPDHRLAVLPGHARRAARRPGRLHGRPGERADRGRVRARPRDRPRVRRALRSGSPPSASRRRSSTTICTTATSSSATGATCSSTGATAASRTRSTRWSSRCGSSSTAGAAAGRSGHPPAPRRLPRGVRGYGTRAELVEAADLAHFTGTAARALNWYRFIYAREPRVPVGRRGRRALRPAAAARHRAYRQLELDCFARPGRPPARCTCACDLRLRWCRARWCHSWSRAVSRRGRPRMKTRPGRGSSGRGSRRSRTAVATTRVGGGGRQSPANRARPENRELATPARKDASAAADASTRVAAAPADQTSAFTRAYRSDRRARNASRIQPALPCAASSTVPATIAIGRRLNRVTVA